MQKLRTQLSFNVMGADRPPLLLLLLFLFSFAFFFLFFILVLKNMYLHDHTNSICIVVVPFRSQTHKTDDHIFHPRSYREME